MSTETMIQDFIEPETGVIGEKIPVRLMVASISSMWRIQSEQVSKLATSHYRLLRHIFFNN
jgi:hypothetical protein